MTRLGRVRPEMRQSLENTLRRPQATSAYRTCRSCLSPLLPLGCMGLQFNRNVSPELLAELRPGGRFEGLVRRRHEWPSLADVQLRRAQGPECHASLYIGLTSVLNVR